MSHRSSHKKKLILIASFIFVVVVGVFLFRIFGARAATLYWVGGNGDNVGTNNAANPLFCNTDFTKSPIICYT